ncbi:peroxiredoxin-like family protein [Fodinicola feengrottensis]|uniref:thioredoxin-dependent peroxiredoxin n=1 Tax=Fodinicola feengrottensis TaxID=435914 RepID=A0ABP4T9C1_9ACTN|nr:peroxiredoxin-like family protein [Fodinicola feengrottensis]
MTSIAEQVTRLQEGMAGQAPAEILAVFGAEQAVLDTAGVPSGVPASGAAMPDGDLLDAHGTATTLEKARGGKPAVVVFYRGAWCPYCNIALRAYEQQLVPELSARGVELVAISPQKPDGSLSMQETNELTFTVLSDPGNQLAGPLGILTAPSEEARGAQGALGLDVTAVNADGTAGIPMPTTVFVDASGVIRWIDVHPNYTTRSEPAAILAAVDAG